MPTRVRSKRFASGYVWRIDVRVGEKRIRKTFEKRKDARDVEDKLKGDALRRRYDLPVESHVSLGELVDKHLSDMKARGRDKTNSKRAETVLGRFRDLVGADRLVETVKRADLYKYVEGRVAAKLKPQSINREMVEIKGCLSAASSYYRALEDWQSPRAPWQEEPDEGRAQAWGDEDRRAVLAQLYGPRREREQQWQYRSRVAVGDMFTIAHQTGMRAGEVRKLRKAQLDFSGRVITVRSNKGVSKRKKGRTRYVPMNDVVYEILKRRAGGSMGDWVFPNRDADGPMSDHTKAFRHACERAGVKYGAGVEGGMIFNDARSTAENAMLDAGQSPRAVWDILGHSPETSAKHYQRSTPQQRRAAVEALKAGVQIMPKDIAATAATAATEEESEARKASG